MEGWGIGNSANGLIITSYFTESLIVLMIFVRLSKWQVPQDGSVMRLQSQWVDVLGAPVWSVNTFIDCSLSSPKTVGRCKAREYILKVKEYILSPAIFLQPKTVPETSRCSMNIY